MTSSTVARRLRGALVLPVLLAPLVLAGCGEDADPFDSYCAVVEEEKPGLSQVLDDDGGSSGLLPALPTFERLEEAAPDDIADDWSVIVQRLGSLADALEAAGADPATYDPVDPPDGVTPDEQEAIALAAGSVATEAVREALENVQQQSRDVCKTELSL
ncbi:hypothetical protein [Nocardioides sp.]|uniref:hypothetical protein n=1 Tax=Nocardioides sp. TaxID=35761 RepID=UPI00271C6A6F|nr:hypothetical protein [Nocardioides sp.]MDO9458193.1 hypothetical protein [Nocardioides sp.]